MDKFFEMIEQHTAIMASLCTILSTFSIVIGYLSSKVGKYAI